MSGTTERHQPDCDVTGRVGQSADHVDFRFSGCSAQRGPTKARQQRNRTNRRRRLRADAVAAESAPQRQQPHSGISCNITQTFLCESVKDNEYDTIDYIYVRPKADE